MNARWIALMMVIAVGGCAMPAMKAAQDFPQQPGQESTAQTRARIHTELSAGYYARGQFDVALEELEGALRIEPGYAPAYGMLGLVYAQLRDDAKADQNFQRSIQLNPQDPDVRNNFGWFLCQRGREPQALGQFELAVQNPFYKTPDVALLNAAQCAAKLGDRKGAEAYYERTLIASPSNPVAQHALAELAYGAGDYQAARARMRGITGAAPSAESLLLGVCIERKLGDKDAEQSYTFQLRQRFPDAGQTKLIESGGCK
ncbi:MAG: type IV pilus biogenesis/stability protein PilW [Betaproteobacteria bacterium]